MESYGIIYSFLMPSGYSTVRAYHTLFIHSPIEGHLSCFQFGAGKNKAAMSIHVQLVILTHALTYFG